MFLTRLPLWALGIIIVVGPTLLAMTAPFFIRRGTGFDRLKINNEVAGFKFAVVGVLYAVLLAFAVIVVWERFSESEGMVASEAGAAATIYRLTKGVDETSGSEIRIRLTTYLEAAIADDWPAMAQGT